MSSTLRDVAERSGVSVTTASRILNGRETGVPIRGETRDRVLAAAADLGYKPNLLARGLRGSRSSLIGVIARDVSDHSATGRCSSGRMPTGSSSSAT